ncbi:hypothetical protein DSO57_1032688 [Entomophthora muscae]|uniref:Uncharacterized protein n=1 Tax=Entomophthora muscae TaxID=34485 RepID=A0ACC2T067_9FUNG|nr:hypothetical protein DSO57_1032688 [Entomophthora muscae]
MDPESCLRGSYDETNTFVPKGFARLISSRIFWDGDHVTSTVSSFMANLAEKMILKARGF